MNEMGMWRDKLIGSSVRQTNETRLKERTMKNRKIFTVFVLAVLTTLFAAGTEDKTGRDFYNAPIDLRFPTIGDVGDCYLQTFSNGWTRTNIDTWRCEPQAAFSNGVASVMMRDGVDKWTILRPDTPLYRFGRFYCGFVREDRSNGDHAIFAALFFDGELIGGEYLRAGFDWQAHTWREYDNVPDGIKQLGGGEWELGVIVVSDPTHQAKAYTVDIVQMIIKSDEPFRLSRTVREWIRRATFSDIKDKYAEINRLTGQFRDEIPVLTNSDSVPVANCVNNLSIQFLEIVKRWKITHASTSREKYRVLSQLEKVNQIHSDAYNLHYPRGSHIGPDFAEDLTDQLLEAWMLDEYDAKLWEAVSTMHGKIDKYELIFEGGFARSEDEKRDDNQTMFKVFKVQCDFYKCGEYVYAKVIGDDADFCYMPCSYEIPAWVVKVNSKGEIVKTYPYPKKVSSLRALLGKDR